VSGGTVVGLRPWLPWPLGRSRWWTQPIRAERLAALRVGLAAVLLLDVLTTYLPHAADFYGRDSLGAPEVFARRFAGGSANWSLLEGVESPAVVRTAVLAWAAAAAGLLLGLATRLCAAAAWALSVSFAAVNPSVENAGDTVRTILLFYLMLCPCGAAWSLDAWLLRKRRGPGPFLVYPWPARLLLVQLVCIYFRNGLHKVVGHDWTVGDSLYYVLADLTLARWSYAWLPVPFLLTRLLTWLVMGWEFLFPVLLLWRRLRVPVLCVGVAFHLGIWLCLELGGFAPYMLCLYLPLLPWKRWADRRLGLSPAAP
jgi:uncharacterized membrane protein YphA (DoxX/SURF4 family)